jgi:hypothetical protein
VADPFGGQDTLGHGHFGTDGIGQGIDNRTRRRAIPPALGARPPRERLQDGAP